MFAAPSTTHEHAIDVHSPERHLTYTVTGCSPEEVADCEDWTASDCRNFVRVNSGSVIVTES